MMMFKLWHIYILCCLLPQCFFVSGAEKKKVVLQISERTLNKLVLNRLKGMNSKSYINLPSGNRLLGNTLGGLFGTGGILSSVLGGSGGTGSLGGGGNIVSGIGSQVADVVGTLPNIGGSTGTGILEGAGGLVGNVVSGLVSTAEDVVGSLSDTLLGGSAGTGSLGGVGGLGGNVVSELVSTAGDVVGSLPDTLLGGSAGTESLGGAGALGGNVVSELVSTAGDVIGSLPDTLLGGSAGTGSLGGAGALGGNVVSEIVSTVGDVVGSLPDKLLGGSAGTGSLGGAGSLGGNVVSELVSTVGNVVGSLPDKLLGGSAGTGSLGGAGGLVGNVVSELVSTVGDVIGSLPDKLLGGLGGAGGLGGNVVSGLGSTVGDVVGSLPDILLGGSAGTEGTGGTAPGAGGKLTSAQIVDVIPQEVSLNLLPKVGIQVNLRTKVGIGGNCSSSGQSSQIYFLEANITAPIRMTEQTPGNHLFIDGCNVTIQPLDISFPDSLKKALPSTLPGALCPLAKDVLDILNSLLGSFNSSVPLGLIGNIQYSIANISDITESYLQTDLKTTVTLKDGGAVNYPYNDTHQGTLPPINKTSEPQLCIYPCFLGSVLAALQKDGQMDLVIRNGDVPDLPLTTTTFAKTAPKVGDSCSEERPLVLNSTVSSVPVVTLQNKHATVTLLMKTNVLLTNPNNSLTSLFVLGVEITLGAQFDVHNNRLKIDFSLERFCLSLDSSSIGNFNVYGLTGLSTEVLSKVYLPFINSILDDGILLPMNDYANYTSASLLDTCVLVNV